MILCCLYEWQGIFCLWCYYNDCDVCIIVELGKVIDFDVRMVILFEGECYNVFDDVCYQVKYVLVIW